MQPWRQRIAAAHKPKELLDLRQEMLTYHVLDPACGSGNFLYVAYRELKRLELELLDKIEDKSGKAASDAASAWAVGANQFYGIDIKPFAVELAKVTLMLAKKLGPNQFLSNASFLGKIQLPLASYRRSCRCLQS